jgi:hypothetical protein
MTVVSGANDAAKKDQPTMTLAGAKHLASVPRERRTVEGNED